MTGTPYKPIELQKYYITGDASKEPTDLLSGAYIGTAPGQVVSVFTKVDKTRSTVLSFNISFPELTGFGKSITVFVGSYSPVLAPSMTDGGAALSLNSSIYGNDIMKYVPFIGMFFTSQSNASSTLEYISTEGRLRVAMGYCLNDDEPYLGYLSVGNSDAAFLVTPGSTWPQEDLYMGFIYDSGQTEDGSTAGSVYIDEASAGSFVFEGYVNAVLTTDVIVSTVASLPDRPMPSILDIVDVDTLGYTPEVAFDLSPGCRTERFFWSYTIYSLFCTDMLHTAPQAATSFFKMPDLDEFGSFTVSFFIAYFQIAAGSPLVVSFGQVEPLSSAKAAFDIILDFQYNSKLGSISYYSEELGHVLGNTSTTFNDSDTLFGMYFSMTATKFVDHYTVNASLAQGNAASMFEYGFYSSINVSDSSIVDFNRNGTAPYWSIGEYGAAGNNLQLTSVNMSMSEKVYFAHEDSNTSDNPATSSSSNTSTAVIVGASVGGVLAAAAAVAYVVRRARVVPSVADMHVFGEKSYQEENPLYAPRYLPQENEIYQPADLRVNYERY